MQRIVVLSLIVISSVALGQGAVYVPDNQAGVGTCNAIPLSASFAAASTYLARVPASFMDPLNPRIDEISFAPCVVATWSAPTIQMGIGHVPNPLPIPFTNPTFDGAGNVIALGSFLDYHVLWNSVSQGAFTYVMAANAWSPLGFAPGGTGFVWDGTNDVGYFLTFSGSTGGGNCHRTATEPFRVYASGTYQAPMSASSGAAGLKMEFLVSAGATITPVGIGCPGTLPVPPVLFTTAVPFIGNAAFHLDVTQGLGGAASFVYVSVGLAAAPLPIGGGCNVYLDVPSVLALLAIGFNPIGPFFLDAAGAGTIGIPIPPDPGIAGIHAGFQAAVLDAGAVNGLVLTNALDALLN